MEKKEVGFKHHPETAKGEVFLTNISNSFSDAQLFDHDDRSDWESIGWRTKRRGLVAYDIYGKPISGMRPVFVQRDELLKGGVDPDKLWKE